MEYIQLNVDGTFKRQLPSGNIEFDDTHFCPASALTADEAATFNVVPVIASLPPAYNRLIQTCTQDGSELVNGEWQYKWVVSELPSEIATQNIVEAITVATQERLDSFARTRNYDGILSACTYATDPLPAFAAEGQYCVAARSSTWATLYAFMAEVQAGTQTMPTSFADVASLLPTLTWPN